jgi:hypothetical protein
MSSSVESRRRWRQMAVGQPLLKAAGDSDRVRFGCHCWRSAEPGLNRYTRETGS